MSKQTRRVFIKKSTLSSFAFGTGWLGNRNGVPTKNFQSGEAKNTIFLVTEG